MPSHVKKRKSETTAEFQAREFPGRIATVKRKTAKVLARGSGSTRAERAKATTAHKAAVRVEKRLAKAGKQRKGTAGAVTRPDKGKSTPASRRRKVEKATGTSGIADPLRAVQELAKRAGARSR